MIRIMHFFRTNFEINSNLYLNTIRKCTKLYIKTLVKYLNILFFKKELRTINLDYKTN